MIILQVLSSNIHFMLILIDYGVIIAMMEEQWNKGGRGFQNHGERNA